MIQIAKSGAVPSSLARGVPATAANCLLYDADPNSYRSGASRFEIKKGIYGTKVVKRQLKADQFDKCCYCEGVFHAHSAGDVEHYRPKGAVQTDAGKVRPGYYWLGYSWTNLHYACQDCNAYRKVDRFPLVDELQRARDHHSNIALEDPLLLDPAGAKDPRQHITFKGEAAIGLTREGEATIEICQLNRTNLALARRNHLEELTRTHRAIVKLEEFLQHHEDAEALAMVAEYNHHLANAAIRTALFSAASNDHVTALRAGQNYLAN